ncbi:MAG: SIMPL domain-containing protein [Candidatus Parcubacteria bacterium]|nr:SIMPL domain-containing protein [Candidatus Parcubacteria bacterium]
MEELKKHLDLSYRSGIFNLALILLFVALIVYVSVGASNQIKTGRYIGQDVVSKNTITVSGEGEIYAKPDLALDTFTVTTEAKTVEKAVTDNTGKMNAIIDAMKALGIEDKDLKTTSFNIYPRYEYKTDYSVQTDVWPKPETRVLVGYEVNQSLEVKIRDMTKVGDVLQKAVDAGANQVGGLQFTIDDPDTLKDQARDEAIKQAKDKAEILANQLGVKLTKITNFSEGGYYPQPLYYDSSSAKGMGELSATPDIQTGENKITVNVSITYEIN